MNSNYFKLNKLKNCGRCIIKKDQHQQTRHEKIQKRKNTENTAFSLSISHWVGAGVEPQEINEDYLQTDYCTVSTPLLYKQTLNYKRVYSWALPTSDIYRLIEPFIRTWYSTVLHGVV